MASLEIQFGGLRLKNPVIMASAPPTETIENIVRCAEAGAAAAVTKTIADFDESTFSLGARRVRLDKRGLWALSTFRRETLTLKKGAELVAGSAREARIPIIASVGALDMSPEAWLPACVAMRDAGASMIQLDLFYIPHPRCSPASIAQLRCLLEQLATKLDIPIAPKLNIDLPAHYAADVLSDSPIAAIFAIDSIRVPPPLNLNAEPISQIANAANAGECSLFGQWQKPITLQYTRVLAERIAHPVCSGGGFMTGADAVEAMMLGATTVQFATAVITGGFKRIGTIIRDINAYLDLRGYSDVAALRGIALEGFAGNEAAIDFGDLKAEVNHGECIMCGKCTSQVFCSDIREVDGRIEVLKSCDGCGLCVEVCPTKPKALALVNSATWRQDGVTE